MKDKLKNWSLRNLARAKPPPSPSTITQQSPALSAQHLKPSGTTKNGGSAVGPSEKVERKDSASASAAQPSAKPRCLWKEAYNRLSKEDSALIKIYVPQEPIDFQVMVDDLQAKVREKHRLCEEKRWTFSVGDHSITVRDKAEKVITWLGKLKLIGSGAPNADPIHIGLPWAGLRIILQAAVCDQQQLYWLLHSLDKVFYTLTLCKGMEKCYPAGFGSPDVPAELKTALVDLYVCLLRFLYKAISIYEEHTTTRILHAFWNSAKITEFEDSCNTLTDRVRDQLEISNVHQDRAFQTGVTVQMREVLGELTNLESTWSEEKREKCHQIFRLTEGGSYEDHKDRVGERVEGTCDWFLNQREYQNWMDQDSGLLMVTADPGCGKSVLAKYLINNRLKTIPATVCYYFFKDQAQNRLKQATCALLHQLFSHKPSLIRHAMPEFSKNGEKLIDVSAALLWDILVAAGKDSETGPAIFVLDALDECEPSDLSNLLKILKSQFSQNGGLGKVKILTTSRPYGHIMSEFRKLENAVPCIHIPGENESEAISQEVNHVIKSRVNSLAIEKELRPEIKDHLEERLLKTSNRTYLWVHLVFDYLEKQDFKRTKKGIVSPIDTLPESVNQAYEKIFSKSSNQNMARKALCIIFGARRPLTVAEMNIAVNIDISHGSDEVFDPGLDLETAGDFEKSLKNACGLFISIYNDRVYFLHQTVREFLHRKISPLHGTVSGWNGSISDDEAHSALAVACVGYLSTIRTLSNDNTFLEYSAENWVFHFHLADVKLMELLEPSIHKIRDPEIDDCLCLPRLEYYTGKN